MGKVLAATAITYILTFLYYSEVAATDEPPQKATCHLRDNTSVADCTMDNGLQFEAVISKRYVKCNGRWGWVTASEVTSD